jgi:RNA recognition motif-containing protein
MELGGCPDERLQKLNLQPETYFDTIGKVSRTDSFLARTTNQINGVQQQLSFTVFLGNLPVWVTADDIKTWLSAEDLVADSIKVIRNHETQESKGFAFVEAPTSDEMQAIIKRFDRAPLEDRLLRANPAQPTKPKGQVGPAPERPPRRDVRAKRSKPVKDIPAKSAFAAELAKVL